MYSWGCSAADNAALVNGAALVTGGAADNAALVTGCSAAVEGAEEDDGVTDCQSYEEDAGCITRHGGETFDIRSLLLYQITHRETIQSQHFMNPKTMKATWDQTPL